MTADELTRLAMREPIGVDISDYGDEFCAGFLQGQANVLIEVFAGRLVLPAVGRVPAREDS